MGVPSKPGNGFLILMLGELWENCTLLCDLECTISPTSPVSSSVCGESLNKTKIKGKVRVCLVDSLGCHVWNNFAFFAFF